MSLPLLRSSAPPSVLRTGPSRPLDVLFLLPPDFYAPTIQRVHRIPPQGPALVAAAVRDLDVRCRVVDLELSVLDRPLAHDWAVLDDDELVRRHLAGEPQEPVSAFLDALLARVGPLDADVLAISLERHTQITLAALVAQEVKRRTGMPNVIGGTFANLCLDLCEAAGTRGVDVVTKAETPPELRQAFEVVRALPKHRWDAAFECRTERLSCEPDDWPVPDFSIFDLEPYRRDPFALEPARFRGYRDRDAHLVLPYHFTFDCQYACSFCQRGGTQSAKSGERAARDLATLAERHGARDFVLFDSQINLHAMGFARALVDAKVDVRWSNSFRAMPRKPGDMELLARSGCVGLTFGIESGSTRMLKRMVKGHLPMHATRVVRDAHAAEILTRVNMLTCFPGERREDHLESVRWLEENAAYIDDLAPSSFYLATGSPVLDDPDRYGIRVRTTRSERGDYRFRKKARSLTYDEVDGMTWEEREPLLRATEIELHEAWSRARGPKGPLDGIRPRLVFAVRRRFATKADAYREMVAWNQAPRQGPGGNSGVVSGGSAPVRPAIVAPAPPAPELLGHFDRVLAAAAESIERCLGRRPRGHLVVFDDGDYVVFRGDVEFDGAAPTRARIENLVASSLRETSARRAFYGRLSPGSTVEFAAADADAPQSGRDYFVASFAPPA